MGFPPTEEKRSSFCPGTRCGCASAVLLRPPSVNTGIEFWPGNFWPWPGRLPPKSCGSHFCSAENLGWLLSPCAGATLCTVSIAVYICLEPLAMGTSGPSGPSGVSWASSTCRHVGAHEDLGAPWFRPWRQVSRNWPTCLSMSSCQSRFSMVTWSVMPWSWANSGKLSTINISRLMPWLFWLDWWPQVW